MATLSQLATKIKLYIDYKTKDTPTDTTLRRDINILMNKPFVTQNEFSSIIERLNQLEKNSAIIPRSYKASDQMKKYVDDLYFYVKVLGIALVVLSVKVLI